MSLSDRTLVRTGRAMGLTAVLLSVSGVVIILSAGQSEALFDDFVLQVAILGAGFGAFAWVVAKSQHRNTAVWILTWGALLGGVYASASAVLCLFLASAGFDYTALSETSVAEIMERSHPAAAVPLWVANSTAVGPFFLVILSWAFFPDGELLSRRWKVLVWVAVADSVLVAAALAWTFRPSSTTLPYVEPWEYPGFGYVAFPGTLALVLLGAASAGSLFIRYRRSDESVLRQIRWILWGGGAFMVALGIEAAGVSQIPTIVALVALVVSYGIAITKYRLYDIDIVISKTFVYASLAAFIGAVYVAVVVGVGAAFGGGTDPNPVLAVVATALIAVAFQPLRRRLQKVSNRIVYGKKATPYEVLSDFSRQVAATDESLLEPLARSLAEGTTASGAAVWILDDGHLRRLSAWPEPSGFPSTVPVGDPSDLNIEGTDVVLPVVEGEELLGALTLSTPQGQSLGKPDMELAGELTSGIGLALRNITLTRALEDRVDELRDSRRRIVAVQDETRRELERDLHDGAQQRLVALKVKLALAGQMATRDGAERTADFLGELSGQADDAIAELREFARGIYPPLLEAEGLTAAVGSEAQRLAVVVDVATEGVGRYPKSLEATVYFCVLEALHNVVRHSGAASAQVTLEGDDESLHFEVRDAGIGFDPLGVETGTGLQNMRDRIEAAGGSLSIESTGGTGTIVSGSLPVEELR